MPNPTDCATLQALFEGVDAARVDAERQWGFERLPLLVSDDLRAKLRRQQAKWSAAYQTAWDAPMLTRDMLAEVELHAGGMKRAWAALDAAATEAGHRPVFPDVWEVPLEGGKVAAFVRTEAEASKVRAEGRYVVVYTAVEVGHVIDALPAALQLAKAEFQGARFIGTGDRSWVGEGDPLPDFTAQRGEAA